jgi:hypothetical protein
MNITTRFNQLKYKDAYLFISMGLLLLFVSVLFNVLELWHTTNAFLIQLNEIVVQFLSHIGIGCMAIGIITIIIDMAHWTAYFETRLSKIVTEKQYLEKLDTDSLIILQTEVLKAYFKNDNIGGSDGFLSFYQKNIQAIIGMPFRVNVQMDLTIEYEDHDRTKVRVTEMLSYTCMSNAGKIQENVCYLPEEGEEFEIVDFEVTLQHDGINALATDTKNGIKKYDYEGLVAAKACESLTQGFNLDIKSHNHNELGVFIKVQYLFNINKFFSWRMSHPSRNVKVTIKFPKDLSLQREYFSNATHISNEDIDDDRGTYFLSVNNWLMPDEGLAFQFSPKVLTPEKDHVLSNTHVSTNGLNKGAVVEVDNQ